MRYAWLPEILAEIAEVAGLDAALGVAAARGGTAVYIPASAGDDHWLVKAAGRAGADAICRHFAFSADGVARHGADIVLPLGPRGSIPQIRAKVDRMILEKKSVSEIALACGMTSRSVERRKARQKREPSAQGTLL